MARASRSRFGCCLFLVFLFLLPFGALVALLIWAGGQAPPLEDGTTLEIQLAGGLHEGPSQNPLAELLGEGGQSLFSIRQALRQGARDPRISGVLLDIESLGSGLAVVEELLAELEAFRASGKPVQAYLRGDLIGEKEYLLALGADQIWLVPESGLIVNGFQAEVTFWKGTLDKLGVQPQVLMMKEYKSAGEPYSRYEMSEAFRESLQKVLDDFMASMVTHIASRRQQDESTVRQWIDRGLLTAQEALQARWVDKLGYRDQVEQVFIDAARTPEYRSCSPSRYLQSPPPAEEKNPVKIAVVFGEGPIVANDIERGFNPMAPTERSISGPQLARVIEEAANTPGIRSIVLRVSSPGGSAVGSDHIRRAIEKAQGRGKKVIVSMSDVAGSGGYWIAMGADKIVCHPTTITGSIGVVFTKFDLTGLYTLIGANISKVKVGKNADLLSFTGDLEGQKLERITTWMEELYQDFKKGVAEGRGLSLEEVETLARGRIWSGKDALDLKLVDALGGLETALDIAREEAGLPSGQALELVPFPKSPSLVESLLQGQISAADLGWTAPEGQIVLPSAEKLREMSEPSVELLAPSLVLN